MKEADVIIGEGNLDDKGVYAGREFKRDEMVIRYHLKPLTQEELQRLPEKERELFTHVQNGVIYLYSIPERYVNHSDDPNTYVDYENKRDIASRDIKKGEMITCDTSKDDI